MAAALSPRRILALDVGDVRVGMAVGSTVAKLPSPIETLKRDDTFWEKLTGILEREEVNGVVVGLPRNMSGEETAQSALIRTFSLEFSEKTGFDVSFVDESLSSHRADTYLQENNSSRAAQDSLAAAFILQEYFDMMEEHEV